MGDKIGAASVPWGIHPIPIPEFPPLRIAGGPDSRRYGRVMPHYRIEMPEAYWIDEKTSRGNADTGRILMPRFQNVVKCAQLSG
jgi:hypothetical protein